MNGYECRPGPPSIDDYLFLRERSGLSPRRRDQAAAAIRGAWCAVHVVHRDSGATVGMGRVLGDGGWYFHVIDMAVLPEHQRRGLGDTILSALLDRVRDDAPAGAVVNMIADPAGQALYARHGFTKTAPASAAMSMVLD